MRLFYKIKEAKDPIQMAILLHGLLEEYRSVPQEQLDLMAPSDGDKVIVLATYLSLDEEMTMEQLEQMLDKIVNGEKEEIQ